MMETLEVVQPREDLKEAYLDYLDECRQSGESLVPFVLGYEADNFPSMIGRLHRDHLGIGLAAGWVPHSTYWLVRDGSVIVGVANLRHRLTDALRQEGGHIGFGVRPTARRRGYASYLLSQMLLKAAELGISRLLLTCDHDNVASAKVIVNNGGKFDSETTSPKDGRIVHRYWIDL